MKSLTNYIFFDVKLQRKSIAYYQTLNDRNMLHSFHTVEVVQKRLSTPWNIFYVPWKAISSCRRVGVNFSLLWFFFKVKNLQAATNPAYSTNLRREPSVALNVSPSILLWFKFVNICWYAKFGKFQEKTNNTQARKHCPR